MSTITVGQAVVLGAVEGVTEFLPVSSTGHLKITEGLMGIQVEDKAVVGFSAVIQVGAIAAVLVYFRGTSFGSAPPGSGGSSTRGAAGPRLPVRVVGDRRDDPDRGRRAGRPPLIEGPLASLWVVAGSLIVGSGVMWVAEQVGRRRRAEGTPGSGTRCSSAVRRSSLCSSPASPAPAPRCPPRCCSTSTGWRPPGSPSSSASRPSPAPGLYELKDALGAGVGAAPLIVGTTVSFAVAYASVAWLLKFVTRHSFNVFVAYRIVVGVLLFGLLGAGGLS